MIGAAGGGGPSSGLWGVIGGGIFAILAIVVDRVLAKRKPRSEVHLRDQERLDAEWTNLFATLRDQYERCRAEGEVMREEIARLRDKVDVAEAERDELRDRVDDLERQARRPMTTDPEAVS